MKPAAILTATLTQLAAAAAHTGEDTPGFQLHHLPVWGWAIIMAAVISAFLTIYIKTHDIQFPTER